MSAVAAGLCALGAARAERAGAQCLIPDRVVTQTSVDTEGRAAIDACAAAAKTAFTGTNAAIKDARVRILLPLQGTMTPSVAFRAAYEQALNPVLTPVATGTNEYAAINALVIAGELSAGNSLAVLQAGLGDKRAAVRMEASAGFARTFQILRLQGAPSILPQRVSAAVTALGNALKTEQDPMVVDGIITALTEATRLPSATVPGAANAALSEIATRMTTLMQQPGTSPAMLPAVLRAGSTVQDALGVQAGAVTVDASTAGTLKAFADAGVAFADRVAKAEDVSEEDKQRAATLAERCGNIQQLLEGRQGTSATR